MGARDGVSLQRTQVPGAHVQSDDGVGVLLHCINFQVLARIVRSLRSIRHKPPGEGPFTEKSYHILPPK